MAQEAFPERAARLGRPMGGADGAAPNAVVLLLPGGGAEHSGRRRSPFAAAALLPLARRLVRAARDAAGHRDGGGPAGGHTAPALVAHVLHYRYRGWNGEAAHPAADAEWAVGETVRRYGDVPVCLLGVGVGARAALRAGGHRAVTSVLALGPWLPKQAAVHGSSVGAGPGSGAGPGLGSEPPRSPGPGAAAAPGGGWSGEGAGNGEGTGDDEGGGSGTAVSTTGVTAGGRTGSTAGGTVDGAVGDTVDDATHDATHDPAPRTGTGGGRVPDPAETEPVKQLIGRHVLLVHGTNDARTDPEQSYRLAERAKKVNADVCRFEAHTDGHGLRQHHAEVAALAEDFVLGTLCDHNFARPLVDALAAPPPLGLRMPLAVGFGRNLRR